VYTSVHTLFTPHAHTHYQEAAVAAERKAAEERAQRLANDRAKLAAEQARLAAEKKEQERER
jgi:hypothetical protein